ncbi:Hypothetical predicted protein [Mytilus galloprovincialis]|uniref:C1q domain-containing protein n=2 Tax=Mytilus galloprovincialis TaxID=29158 RepID=A0A8B6GJC6_MYTGA|nr:Hypothetical predicted protein [Mytilus galloprovincialis]
MIFTLVMAVRGYDLQTLWDQMEANEKITTNEISRLTREVTTLRSNENRQMAEISYLRTEVNNLKLWKGTIEKLSEPQNRFERLLLPNYHPDAGVAFSAYKSSSFNAASFGRHRELVYDKTECNVGNGYSTFTGTFTATISGTYAFTWTTCAGSDSGAIGIELVINNMVHGLLWTDSQTPGDEECSTGFIIRTLNAADAVFTRSQNNSAGHFGTIRSDEFMRTTFSGWLLF